MRFYQVIVRNQYGRCDSQSRGFRTREAAERMLIAMAHAGKAPCGGDVEPYEGGDDDDDESED